MGTLRRCCDLAARALALVLLLAVALALGVVLAALLWRGLWAETCDAASSAWSLAVG